MILGNVMARIRTVKPEFATDGKIRRLSDSTALFFILLWNHCDDSGYFTLDTWELALKTGRWRAQEVSKFLSALVGAGLVKTSRGVGVGLVEGWSHQRIDKPRPSKWEEVEIVWDDAVAIVEESKTVPRKERKGKERIGEERIIAQPSASPAEVVEENPTNIFLATYCEAFKRRYGSNPPITGKAAGIAKRIVKDLGLSRACELAETYVGMSDSFYLTRRHDLATFALNLNAVSVKHDTGDSISRHQAQRAEIHDANVQAMKDYMAGKVSL